MPLPSSTASLSSACAVSSAGGRNAVRKKRSSRTRSRPLPIFRIVKHPVRTGAVSFAIRFNFLPPIGIDCHTEAARRMPATFGEWTWRNQRGFVAVPESSRRFVRRWSAIPAPRCAEFALLLQAVLLDPVLEGAKRNAEDPRRLFAVPPRLVEHFPDGFPFVRLEDAILGGQGDAWRFQVQVGHPDLALCGDYGALDHVLQLPHVARPGIIFKGRPGSGGKTGNRFAESGGELFQEIIRQGWKGLPAFRPGRKGDRKDVQPVIEILPEPRCGDLRLEVLVRRRDDPR